MRKSSEPRIVNLSSGLASQTVASDTTNPFYLYKATGYQSSKTALNMYTINLAFDLRETNFKVNSVCPGFTSTDINNHQGPGKVEDAAKRVIKYASVGNDGPSGKFFCEEYFPDCIKLFFLFMQNKASLILKRLTNYRRFSTTWGLAIAGREVVIFGCSSLSASVWA